MKLARLLKELDALTHSRRMRRMVELGRDPGYASLIDELSRGTAYQRGLALMSCFGSREAGRILAFLEDASARLRALARRLAAHYAGDAQVADALERLTPAQLQEMLRVLLRHRRGAAIDAWFERAPRKPRYLAYCSSAVVRRHLKVFVEMAGGDDWARLGRFHPEVAAELLESWAARAQGAGDASEQDNHLAWACERAFPGLVEHDPDAALRLLDRLLTHLPLRRFNLYLLALRRPEALAPRIVGQDERARADFGRRVRRLSAPVLEALLERGVLPNVEFWFRRLARDTRARLFERFGAGWRGRDGSLSPALVQALPAWLRHQEARRNFDLPELSPRPRQRLPYASFLPWEEAEAALKPWIRDPDPELRSLAVTALIRAARYDRDRMDDALALVRQRRNEQDPIRAAMLGALGELPLTRWKGEHLDSLAGAFQEALNASDLSHATSAAIAALVTRLLPHHPEWAAGWLARLAQDRGRLYLSGTRWPLSRRDVQRMAPSLMPVLKSWETREREAYLMSAAQAVGPRLREWPELLDLLQRLVGTTRSQWVAMQALGLLRREDGTRLNRLLPDLLKRDESWAVLAPVYNYLHMCRQDLLTPFLGQRILKGRFTTGKTAFVLPVAKGFERWNPRQHELFHQTLRSLVGDAVRDTPTLRLALEQLAALPVPVDTLVAQARLDNPRPAIRDLALRALARRDEGDGLPTLLTALEDERARIAIYALRRALREARPQDALQLLRDVPTAKVTVAKEVIRLLGELPAELAYGELLRLADADLHRDARVALLRALWDHLEDHRTWPILEQAAVSEDPSLAAGVVRIPADRVSTRARARLVALMASLLRHPEPRVRLDTEQRLAALPPNDPDRLLLDPLVTALGAGSGDERSAAAAALFGVYGCQALGVAAGGESAGAGTGVCDHVDAGASVGNAGDGPGVLEQAVARLLPDRRALVSLCECLEGEVAAAFTRASGAARAVLRALQSDPLTTSLQARLATFCLLPEDLQAWLEARSLHSEALASAVSCLSSRPIRRMAEELDGLEAGLSASTRPELRRLGLAALVASASGPSGWTEGRRGRLEVYRRDADSMVRAAAEFTFPPD